MQLLNVATRIAREHQAALSSEHILLALAQSDKGRAATILAAHGLTPEVIEGDLSPPA
ncbi:MAG TPA: Clp protease N-terminal domain-containing protein [Candidatus Dormibacteraeota bacterium]|nr:Clp protease N-terminal domain-containing protein [Candidatus Dormibacteraeota bacterium]